MRASKLAIALLACAFGASCSNPDNLVVGAILGTGSVPNATIVNVGSALSGTGYLTSSNGEQTAVGVVLLSDVSNLCATLTENPDFLEAPSTAYTVLALTIPPGMVGTFYPGAAGTQAGMFVSEAEGNPVYGYPGVSGTAVFTEFDTRAEGNFDIDFIDTSDNDYEIYGQFKTTNCDAIANAAIPQIVLGN